MTTQELKNKIEKVLGNSIRCLLPSYWWKNLFHSVADSIEEVSTSVNKLSEELSDLDNYVDITRDELFKLVQDGKLVPGRYYRISDYECTVRAGINAIATQNRNFAIVVKALSEDELDENANAAFKPNLGGTLEYNGWQLKYSIFNNIYKYPWAVHGTLEYDASVVLDNPPYTGHNEMVVIWDSTENKYVINTHVDSGYRGYYLVTSETDKTPLAQTSFNYGDIVYIYYLGDVYSAKVSYTKSMRDSGDAVLINPMYDMDVNNVKAFKWDINENAYVSVVDNSIKLKDFEGNILSKRESFTEPEKIMEMGWLYKDWTTFGFYTPNGKGVVYYLKDQYNNEAYYDFKNIAFLFPEISSEPLYTFDWDNSDASVYAKNVKIENAGDLNYVAFNVDPNEIRGGLDSVVVSSKVKNQYFNDVYKNTYIGYDDNNNLAAVNIFNIGEAREEIIIDSELSLNSTNPVENKVITNEFGVLRELLVHLSSSGGYTVVTDTSSFEVDSGYNYIINTESAGDIVITRFNALELPSDNEYNFLNYIQKATIMFKGATSLNLPEGVIWANGIQPDIDSSLEYELSIVRTIIADTITYKAVLTPFYLS